MDLGLERGGEYGQYVLCKLTRELIKIIFLKRACELLRTYQALISFTRKSYLSEHI